MRSHSGCLTALIIAFAAPTFSAQAEQAGTIAIIEGNAYAQKGEIYYTRPPAGAEIKVNQFGQYKDAKPAPAYVKWEQNTRRHLKSNDTIEEGEIIQTMGDGWLKILFKDDSLMDIGPAAMLQVQKFTGAGKQRNVLFKLLYGKVRSVVARPLAGKIVFIRSADPGHDWIFTRKIAGFVTMYGGANSHMAIRAAELRIPSVIGAGEKNYISWSAARRLELDCANRLVRTLQ